MRPEGVTEVSGISETTGVLVVLGCDAKQGYGYAEMSEVPKSPGVPEVSEVSEVPGRDTPLYHHTLAPLPQLPHQPRMHHTHTVTTLGTSHGDTWGSVA